MGLLSAFFTKEKGTPLYGNHAFPFVNKWKFLEFVQRSFARYLDNEKEYIFLRSADELPCTVFIFIVSFGCNSMLYARMNPLRDKEFRENRLYLMVLKISATFCKFLCYFNKL